MPDDMPQVEQYALTDLRDMARSNLLLAWPVIGHPFMGPPFRQMHEYSLDVLSDLSLEPLRVLRQPDPWECTVAYICSAANNFSRIRTIVESVAETLGHPVELEDEVRHTFPTPDMMLEAGVRPLAELGLGMDRHSKIIAAAERIRDGKLDLHYLSQPQVCYAEAKRRLMGCYEIGDKVADCISLFALDKMEAIPVDRWVERAMAGYFLCQEQPTGDELVMWAQDYFGKYVGFANQLLFHEQRGVDNPRPPKP